MHSNKIAKLNYKIFDIAGGLAFIVAPGSNAVIYEIRVYEATEGNADAMKSRFKNEVVKRFPGHGIELLGVFESATETSRLTYLTRFKSEDDRSKAWAAFGADPEWRAIKASSEVDGPLLKQQTVSVLSPAVAGLLLG
jgi:hypothetical protein